MFQQAKMWLNGILRITFAVVLMRSFYGSLAILVLLFALTGSASAYSEIIDLGTLHGGGYSLAESINDNNQIVGCAIFSGQQHSCRFDPTGGGANIDLGSLGFDESVRCVSINNNGQIVGSGHLRYGFTGRACLFDPTIGGNNKNLGILPGYLQSIAYSINNHGQIVGYSENYGPGFASYAHACIFDPTGGGNNIDLGSLNSYAYSHALSINDNNQIVGGAWHDYYRNPYYYDTRACLFDPTGAGANIDLGALNGYNYSDAYSINSNGQIVGYAYNSSSNYRACLFDLTGSGANIDLGTPDGFNNSIAVSNNDHGQIVGYAWDDWSNSRACLFDTTGNGNNIDLNNLINPTSGWTLTNAADINNNGWIVGRGINDGQTHAFLLKTDTNAVPEPATMLLFGSGIVGFVGTRLRRKKQ